MIELANSSRSVQQEIADALEPFGDGVGGEAVVAGVGEGDEEFFAGVVFEELAALGGADDFVLLGDDDGDRSTGDGVGVGVAASGGKSPRIAFAGDH